TPTMTKPFFMDLEKLTIRRRIRMLQAYLFGYRVYYLRENDEYVAYCLVQSGKDSRYKFATENDIMVGPYFVSEKHRGRRLSIILLELVLAQTSFKYNYAYDYIHEDNIPSIKASKAVGFEEYRRAIVNKYTRSLHIRDDGDYYIL